MGPTEGSMEKPSISLLNSSVVILLASCAVLGHWKHPSDSRIYRRINLSPVQRSPLSRSRLVPQNKNKVSFSNGSRPYVSLTMAARPSMPLRRSDLPHYPNIRDFGISTTVAQSYGAGDEARTKKILTAGILVSVTVSLFLTAIVIPTGGKIIALFGAGPDAVKIGSAFFQRIACFYPVYGLATAFRNYLEGKGDLLYSSMAGIAALTVRIIASYAMVSFWGNMVIAYAEMLSWACLLVMYVLRSAQMRLQPGGPL